MAKLGSYYGLCPLIDQKSLLGVSSDVVPGHVIVTLGKNMAIKYKLSDQKQVHSWSTKEKLSSPVVYDKKGERYVAAFNQNFIRVWNESENNLDKIKKIKFTLSLHTIIPYEDEPILVFKTGLILTLSQALENRKNLSQNEIIDKMYNIEDQTCLKINDTCYVGLLLKCKEAYSYIWTRPNSSADYVKFSIDRDGYRMIGNLTANINNGPMLITIWSDGRMFMYPLSSTEKTENAPGTFYSVIETLSREHRICMVALNNNYIAMYGADTNQEGASLQIYNTQFKVTQSKHQLKMFSDNSKLWLIENCLLLTAGQNLAVVPFHLATEQLAALVGSHKLVATADDEDLAIVIEVNVANWENDETNENECAVPSDLKSQINSFVKEGWSESAICEEIFPKLIEKNNINTILSCLNYFIDIPEKVLVKLLSYCINLDISKTKNTNILKYGLPQDEFLNKLLIVSYSDVLLMPCLRQYLKFDEVLILLKYLCHLLGEGGKCLPGKTTCESEGKLIEWGCILLDAHYQMFLLSRDSQILESLKHFKDLVDVYHSCLEDYKKIEPLLSRINRGKCGSKITTGNLKYSIEKIKLY